MGISRIIKYNKRKRRSDIMRRIEKLVEKFNKMMENLDEQVKNKKDYNKEILIKEIGISLECSDNPVTASKAFWYSDSIAKSLDEVDVKELVRKSLSLYNIPWEGWMEWDYKQPSRVFDNYKSFCDSLEDYMREIEAIYNDYLNDKNYQYIKRAYRLEKWTRYLIKGYKVDKERNIHWENRYA
jgi:hypothetical protein